MGAGRAAATAGTEREDERGARRRVHAAVRVQRGGEARVAVRRGV